MSTAEATLTWMSAWLGPPPFTEGPRANQQPFDDMAGHAQDLAWCATFRVAAHRCTGVAIPPGGGTAYTPSNWAAYRRAGLLVDPRDGLQPGDLFWVGYASMAKTRPEGIGHEGTVLRPLEGTRFVSLEANSNQTASRTGGQVASLVRDWSVRGTSRIVAAARPRWDGVVPQLLNLPVQAQHTGQWLAGPVIDALRHPAPAPAASALLVDGQRGAKTIRRLQEELREAGHPVLVDGVIDERGGDGSETVAALQRFLNARIRAGLRIDGKGFAQDGRPYKTVRATQGYLGSYADGIFDTPVSAGVMALQRRLNTGRL